jgi:hypothetical protein
MLGDDPAAPTARTRNLSRIGTRSKIFPDFLLLSTPMFHVEHFFHRKTGQMFHVEHNSRPANRNNVSRETLSQPSPTLGVSPEGIELAPRSF